MAAREGGSPAGESARKKHSQILYRREKFACTEIGCFFFSRQSQDVWEKESRGSEDVWESRRESRQSQDMGQKTFDNLENVECEPALTKKEMHKNKREKCMGIVVTLIDNSTRKVYIDGGCSLGQLTECLASHIGITHCPNEFSFFQLTDGIDSHRMLPDHVNVWQLFRKWQKVFEQTHKQSKLLWKRRFEKKKTPQETPGYFEITGRFLRFFFPQAQGAAVRQRRVGESAGESRESRRVGESAGESRESRRGGESAREGESRE